VLERTTCRPPVREFDTLPVSAELSTQDDPTRAAWPYRRAPARPAGRAERVRERERQEAPRESKAGLCRQLRPAAPTRFAATAGAT